MSRNTLVAVAVSAAVASLVSVSIGQAINPERASAAANASGTTGPSLASALKSDATKTDSAIGSSQKKIQAELATVAQQIADQSPATVLQVKSLTSTVNALRTQVNGLNSTVNGLNSTVNGLAPVVHSTAERLYAVCVNLTNAPATDWDPGSGYSTCFNGFFDSWFQPDALYNSPEPIGVVIGAP